MAVFVCAPQNCACICVKTPYMRVRGQVLWDWPWRGPAAQEGVQGEAVGARVYPKGSLPLSPFPSLPRSFLPTGGLWGIDGGNPGLGLGVAGA